MDKQKKRVLIVEDEEALLFGWKKLLQSGTILVDVARTPQEATELLHKNSYQAVFSDLRLTGSDVNEKYDIVRTARELQKGCKIIIITAYAENGPDYHALHNGVDLFLEKPVSANKIREILNTL